MGMQITEELPIELDCWMLRNGILPLEDMETLYGKTPDFVRPKVESERERVVRTGISNAWKPSYEGEEPPF